MTLTPGDTWSFQLWFRDGSTSNTSTGLAVTFATDGDPAVQFPVVRGETAEAASQLEVVVTLSQPALGPVLVPFTEGGSATAQVDYRVESTNPLVIPAGQSSAALLVTIAHDTEGEADETVVLTLDPPVHAVLGTQLEHTLTILDND
ncbi:MAG: hypothetical protein GY711_12870 [bacterium]|nr:hypothetical protein [bacterium]